MAKEDVSEKKQEAKPEPKYETSRSANASAQTASAPPTFPQPMQANAQQEVMLSTVGKSALISLWLDSYDDLFSDFDPRPYSQRALSDDFLSEIKKVLRESASGKVELELLMPGNLRVSSQESTIKKRLRDYFKMRFTTLKKQNLDSQKQGALFIAFGTVLMLITTFLLFRYADTNFWLTFFSVVAEPAGWFLFWEGMNVLIFNTKEKKPDLEFNERMSNCNIYFKAY